MYLQKFLELKTKSALKKNTSLRNTVDYYKAKKVGIIFSSDTLDKHKAIKSMILSLEDDGKQVEVISFLDDGKENHEFKFNFFSRKDISFFGNIESVDLLNFINKEFDYLFTVDSVLDPIIKNVLALSKSKCRVGKFSTENSPFFELMINPVNKSSTGEFIEEVLEYTRKINSNGIEV